MEKFALIFKANREIICHIVFFAFSVYGGKYLLISPLITPAKSPLPLFAKEGDFFSLFRATGLMTNLICIHD